MSLQRAACHATFEAQSNNNMQAIANKIRSTRALLGISQEELSDLSGLSLRSVQRIEGGETTPRGDSLKRIAQALQIDIRELTQPVAQVPVAVVSAKPDNGIPLLMLLSAYGFMFHPLVGLALPVLLFVLYRNTNPLVKKFGRRIIWIESIYCGFVVLFVLYLGGMRIFHFPTPPAFNFKETLVFFTIGVYVLHILAISFLIFQFARSTRQRPADTFEAQPL
jgi:transcriptional regulator with XRE-family HTH domain